MKIFCIGRNYVAHASELQNEVPTSPVVFMKPATALLKDNQAFYHPEFSNDIHHEVEVVLKIGKNGKHIAEKFATSYISDITLGIDFTARDIQQKCKEKSLPWELAKAFDHSAVIGHWKPIASIQNLNAIEFSLQVNNVVKQMGNTNLVIFSFEKIISYLSTYFTLQQGDLIFTGTPAGVGKVNIGDTLTAYLEQEQMFNFEIK